VLRISGETDNWAAMSRMYHAATIWLGDEVMIWPSMARMSTGGDIPVSVRERETVRGRVADAT
jgi:hypothetical protein